jgi:hypothetical protein
MIVPTEHDKWGNEELVLTAQSCGVPIGGVFVIGDITYRLCIRDDERVFAHPISVVTTPLAA